MRKKILLIIALISVIIQGVSLQPKYYCAVAYSQVESNVQEDLANKIDEQLTNINFNGLDALIKNFSSEQKLIFNSTSFSKTIGDIIKGENIIKFDNFFQSILDILISSVKKYLPIISMIVAVCLICSLSSKIKSKNFEQGVSNIINFACFSVIIILLATTIKSVISIATATIDLLKLQMDISFPILLTLTAALGGVSSVGVYQPAVAILSTGIVQIFSAIVLPLFMMYFVFSILGNMNSSIKLDKFNAFIFSLFKWIIGIVFTVFFAFIAIQGISAGVFDSISIRTAKFTLKSYVPIMGGYLSDGLDLILSSSLLIKNAVGVVGIVLVFANVIIPIIEILILSLLLKFVSAILQPITDSKIISLIENTGKSLTMLLTCIIAIAFMYLILVGLIMTTANVIL